MKMRIKQFIFFALVLLGILSISILSHYYLLAEPNRPFSLLIQCYLTNYFLALIIYFIIERIQKYQTAVTGYVFLGGSLLKFVAYFTFVKPLLAQDGDVEKVRFFFFFIPYALSLIVEVYFLVKLLNLNDEQKKKEKESENN